MEAKQNNAIVQMNNFGKKAVPFFFIIDFEMQEPQVFTLPQAIENNIKIDFPFYKNIEKKESQTSKILLQKKPIAFTAYQKGFNKVMENIKHGNSFLTNYTCATPIELNTDLASVFAQANAKYKVLYKNDWLSFSPETFIQITDGVIATYPMKGTIDATLPNAKKIILANEKEKAEHYTIVDLLRNDISQVATNVGVEKFRYVETIPTNHKNLLQVSSSITGVLPTNYPENLGEIIFAVLPAGSISGAPKKKTVQIIQEAEPQKRGYYTGIALYFDGRNVDSCVLIRYIENTPNGLLYRSGGGITCNSTAEEEFQEMIDKIYLPTI